ncbi:MAG: type II toxin-antitoxin system RelE/ParE family toxin [Sedimenticolaceae bacterium]
MPRFRVKDTARADLKKIAVFTEQTWGRKQRNNYLTEIDQAFHRLAGSAELGQGCDPIRSGYRVFPVGSHLIFYKLAAHGAFDNVGEFCLGLSHVEDGGHWASCLACRLTWSNYGLNDV